MCAIYRTCKTYMHYWVMLNNGTQLTWKEWRLLQVFSIDHITTQLYHSRRNVCGNINKSRFGQNKWGGTSDSLRVYPSTPYPNKPSSMLPAELMLARKVKSVLNNLLPSWNSRNKIDANTFKVGDKVFFRAYTDGKDAWEDGIIATRIGKLVHMLKGKTLQHKWPQNQLTKDVKKRVKSWNQQVQERENVQKAEKWVRDENATNYVGELSSKRMGIKIKKYIYLIKYKSQQWVHCGVRFTPTEFLLSRPILWRVPWYEIESSGIGVRFYTNYSVVTVTTKHYVIENS